MDHQLVCQSGKWLLCPHQVPNFDTLCPRYVGYTISMSGLKTNGTCVGSGSLSSTFSCLKKKKQYGTRNLRKQYSK